MRRRHVAPLALAAAMLPSALPAQRVAPETTRAEATTPRRIVPLLDGWRFRYGPAPAAATGTDFDDAAWDRVSVPHSWNRLGNAGNTRSEQTNAERGVGWYRLTFRAPAVQTGERSVLQFDAASILAEVWLNGQRLGGHAGAFTRFRLDASEAIRPGVDNLLVVKVDNSAPGPDSPTRNIVPISGDFFMFGGLYRPVSLIVTGATHVDLLDHGGPGVYADVTALSDTEARVAVRTRLRNDARRPARVMVRTRIVDADSSEVARVERAITLARETSGEVAATLTVASPRRWRALADPYLYRTVVEVRDAGGRVLDRVTQPLGLRTVAIDRTTGFALNGEHLRLHGVNRHQDHAGKGWALSRADHEQDMTLIREMGANTVRLSHYNQAEDIAEIADRDGLVLMAEMGPVNLAAPKGERETPPEMLESARTQLIEMIRQNYNHPSIGMWSIGNEVTNWTFKGLTPSNARPMMNALNAAAHAEDKTRPTSIAVCCEPLPGQPDTGVDRTSGTADATVYNLYLGWYGNGRVDEANGLGGLMSALHARRPEAIGVGEYGGGAALTQHTDNPFGGQIENLSRPQPEEVQGRLHELSWKQLKSLDFVWGSWAWQMFDAVSDRRLEGDVTDINTKGLVTNDRNVRKDAYFFYQAAWSSALMIHLNGSRYVDRAYPVTDVRAYSNANSATLTLNGRVVGTVPCADAVCEWKRVRLAPGDNRLEASASSGGATVHDAIAWRYSGPSRALHIAAGTLTGMTLTNGTRYGSDDFFDGGIGTTLTPFRRDIYETGPDAPKPKAVTGTSAPALYAAWRSGKHFSYSLPLPDGRYRVTLHLFEPKETAPGARVFTVGASGGARRGGIDLVRLTGGPLRATTISLPATAGGGTLRLDFTGTTGEAVVSAIDVVPAEDAR